jgi:hypothetical protein
MSNDFYFKPVNVRICTDYRDKKEQWYLQINFLNAGYTIKINNKDKDFIIKFVKDMDENCIDFENTHFQHIKELKEKGV